MTSSQYSLSIEEASDLQSSNNNNNNNGDDDDDDDDDDNTTATSATNENDIVEDINMNMNMRGTLLKKLNLANLRREQSRSQILTSFSNSFKPTSSGIVLQTTQNVFFVVLGVNSCCDI